MRRSLPPRRRWPALLAAALALVLALSAPVAADPISPTAGDPQPTQPAQPAPVQPKNGGDEAQGAAHDADPLATLGSDSPMCREGLTGAARSSCDASKSIARPYPLDNYGLDQQVEWGITHLGNTFDRITQWIVVSLWQLALYLVNGVLLMLEWAFSLDLLSRSMGALASALQRLHDTVIAPWGLAVVAGLALWGIWNGLLRNKSIDTLRGLALSLLCMVAVLVLIGDPVDTLGTVTNGANDASKQMLNAISRGTVSQPDQGVASAEEGLFNTIVLGPWCALQFGDVGYCRSTPTGLNQTVADTWLQDVPDSEWRSELARITGAPDREMARPPGSGMFGPPPDPKFGDLYALVGHPDRVALMGTGSTGARLGLLLLVLVGLIGAVCLFCLLAARLLQAALFVLILTMLAPAMFLMAGLGASGRQAVAAWAKRLLGAIVLKIVYALFLAVIVTAGDLISNLNLGFVATWLLFIAFWWGVLLKRDELIGLLSIERHQAGSGLDFAVRGRGGGLGQLYYGMRVGRDAARVVGRVAGAAVAGPRAALRTGGRPFRTQRQADWAAESDVAQDLARDELGQTARAAIGQRRAAEYQQEVAAAAPLLDRERQTSRRVAGIDQAMAMLRARGPAGVANFNTRLAALQRARGRYGEELTDIRADPAFARAQATVRSSPAEAADHDVQAWIAKRRGDLAQRADADENLWAAGIDPSVYRNAGASDQQRDFELAREHMERDRVLLDRVDHGGARGAGQPMRRRERRRARREAEAAGRGAEYERRYADRHDHHVDRLRNERRAQRRERRRRRYVR